MNRHQLFMSTAKAALGTAVVVGGLLLGAAPGFVSPAQAQARRKSRTSSSSWATTSAGSMLAPTTAV